MSDPKNTLYRCTIRSVYASIASKMLVSILSLVPHLGKAVSKSIFRSEYLIKVPACVGLLTCLLGFLHSSSEIRALLPARKNS